MRAVPIPGEILRTTVFLGFTFDELVTLGAIPLVVVFPVLFIEAIPLVVPLVLVVISTFVVLGVVVRTPEGQRPTEWAPAAVKRRLTPDRYTLKPRHRHRGAVTYLDVVHSNDSESAAEPAERLPTVPADMNASSAPSSDQ